MSLPFRTNDECIALKDELRVSAKYACVRRALSDGLTLVMQCINIYIVYTQHYGCVCHAIYGGILDLPRFTLYALDFVNPRKFIGYADFFVFFNLNWSND